eukprot:gb/GECG01003294.1/.p1 GENE.gb/GECG01003294.1/~~gb/GECG01003294.1/.p1  ORF type:complete len:600 (+),score=138.11 gb/GECG01003294.1/:1-1800(+)
MSSVNDDLPEDLTSLKVADLRAKLKEYGQPSTGKKNELVERLQAYFNGEGQQEATEEQEQPKQEEDVALEDSTEATKLKKLTVPKLKEALKERGADTSGKKDDLIQRLIELNQQQSASTKEAEDEKDDDEKGEQEQPPQKETTEHKEPETSASAPADDDTAMKSDSQHVKAEEEKGTKEDVSKAAEYPTKSSAQESNESAGISASKEQPAAKEGRVRHEQTEQQPTPEESKEPAGTSASETREEQPVPKEEEKHAHEQTEQQLTAATTQLTGKRQRDTALSVEESEPSAQKLKVDPAFDSTATVSSYSLEDLYDADRPEVPPAQREPTRNLLIGNLQRPFTSMHLRELVEKAGKLDEEMEGKGLWLQKFKKYAFASFASVNDAEAVRNALYGVRWPTHSQKRLEVDFTDHTAEDAVTNGDPLERESPVETSNRTVEMQSSAAGDHEAGDTDVTKEKEVSGENNSKSVAKNTGTLDSLFMSTETKPKLYYLPLDEEAAEEQRKRRQDMHDKGVLTPTTPEGAAAMGNRPPRGRGRGGRPFRGRGDGFRGRGFRGRGGPPPRRDSYSGSSRYDDRDRRDDRDRYGGRDRRDDRDDRRSRNY